MKDSIKEESYHIYECEDDINAVCKSFDLASINNNEQPSTLDSFTKPAFNRAVGSPVRTPKTPLNRAVGSPVKLTATPRRVVCTPPIKLSLDFSNIRHPSANAFENRPVYQSNDQLFTMADLGINYDEYSLDKDCSSISNQYDILNLLQTVEINSAFNFLKSQRGSRRICELMNGNSDFCKQIAKFVIQNHFVSDLSMTPSGNFVIQRIIGEDPAIDNSLCEQLYKDMPDLVLDKYGCRVAQILIQKVNPELVKRIVETLSGYEVRICLDKNGTHVVECLLDHHVNYVYESFFYVFTNKDDLRVLMENKFGCRIVQSCLDALARQITFNYVPPVLNDIIISLLQDADRYSVNEYANYVIQFIIKHPSFQRHRDYIIDNIILRNVLRLSQGKFSSHVVEAALSSGCPSRVARICNEIYHDYKIIDKNRTPLEILLFDQYGNYVVQTLLKVAIDVSIGRFDGDASWLSILKAVVIRNQPRLQRYSSGKKILQMLGSVQNLVRNVQPLYPQKNGYMR